MPPDLERRIAALEQVVELLQVQLADARHDTAVAHQLLAISRRFHPERYPDPDPPA